METAFDIISLVLFIVVILLAFFRKVNVGVVAVTFGVIMVRIFGLTDKDLIGGFSTSMFTTLVGITLLFAAITQTGALDLLARKIIALAGNKMWVLPIMVYIAGFVIAGVGPGAVPALAIIPALAAIIAVEVGFNPLMLVLIGEQGLMAGRMTPITPEAAIITGAAAEANIHRCENYAALKPEIEKWSSQHTIADCVAIIDAAGVPVAPINMLADVVNDDHIANAREMFVHLQHPVIGDMIVPGNPVKLMDTKPEITKCAPDLGQDNKEIYEGVLGLSDADLARLKEEKVI